jgi:hypothetical protein
MDTSSDDAVGTRAADIIKTAGEPLFVHFLPDYLSSRVPVKKTSLFITEKATSHAAGLISGEFLARRRANWSS